MNAVIEFVEMKRFLGVKSRIRKTVAIKVSGKNRREALAIKTASKLYPDLTVNRVVRFINPQEDI
jgi:hypothetical protein